MKPIADATGHALPRTRNAERPWYHYATSLFPAEPGRWIDLGCGRGEFVEHVWSADAMPSERPLALDLAEHNARGARASGASAIVANLERGLPLVDAGLDGASLVEVIEHLPRAETIVDELARTIRPGGWLIVTTPNVAHFTYRVRAVTGHAPKQEGYHFRFFTRARLEDLFARRGFRLEARASYGKQALLTKLARISGDRTRKVRYRVPRALESLLAQHFVWRFVRENEPSPR